ncbi:MAG: FtsW/RodA/SpoVE family cell cycle protein, partial [bacterium]
MRSGRLLLNSSRNLADHHSRTDLGLFVATVILVGFGTIMVYSSSAIYAWASSEYGNEFFFLKRHLLRLGIGICAMLVAQRLDYRFWSKMAKPLMGLSVALLVAVLLVGSGRSHGASRWLRLSFLSVQPAELTKVCLVIYLASYISAKSDRLKDFKTGLLPPLILLGVITALVVKQPNFGTAAALLLIGFLILYVGGARMHHLLGAGVAGMIAVALIAYTVPYARHRILGFIGTSTGALESNYQLRQSFLGMGSGGLFGEGLGRSKVKLLSLPEPHTDFIFAVVAEEMGFVGATILMGTFLFVMLRGMHIAGSSPDNFGLLLASGLSISIFTYVLLHIAVVVGAL